MNLLFSGAILNKQHINFFRKEKVKQDRITIVIDVREES